MEQNGNTPEMYFYHPLCETVQSEANESDCDDAIGILNKDRW